MYARDSVMKILLTGGLGHLAKAFIRLFGTEHELTATIRKADARAKGTAKYVVAPDAIALAALLDDESFDAIVHLAQTRHAAMDSINNLDAISQEAALFSVILNRAISGSIDRLFVASTGGLYADKPGSLKETDLLLQPPNLDTYYASKLMLESMVSPHFGDLDVTIGRFFFIYGPDQDSSKLITRLIDSVKSKRVVRVSPSGGVKLNPIFVDDAARAIQCCLGLHGARILNVAGPETSSIRDLTQRIGDLLQVDPDFELNGDDRNLVADISTLESIGVGKLTGLDDGLKQTISWAGR